MTAEDSTPAFLDTCGPAEAAVRAVLKDTRATNLDTLAHEIVDAVRPHLTALHDGIHEYTSTGCLHGDDHVLPDGRTGHDYCKGMTGMNGTKRPASCKFCEASCQCPCHKIPEETR